MNQAPAALVSAARTASVCSAKMDLLAQLLALNQLYLAEPGSWQSDFAPAGFSWIDASDNLDSVIAFVRRDADRVSEAVVILNFTPVTREHYRIGLPRPGKWLEVMNSDAAVYAVSNVGNLGGVMSEDVDWPNHPRRNSPCRR